MKNKTALVAFILFLTIPSKSQANGNAYQFKCEGNFHSQFQASLFFYVSIQEAPPYDGSPIQAFAEIETVTSALFMDGIPDGVKYGPSGKKIDAKGTMACAGAGGCHLELKKFSTPTVVSIVTSWQDWKNAPADVKLSDGYIYQAICQIK